MKDVVPEPNRLRDHHDQLDLVERIAGQAARDSAEPEPLPTIVMARIAARIDARRGRERRWHPLSWAMVIGAFLLGIVTAASAAHLDLLPAWLGRIVPGLAKHSSNRATSRRAPAGKPAAATVARPAGPAPVAEPVVEPVPAPSGDVQPLQAKAVGQTAMSPAGRRGSAAGRPPRVAMLADGPAAPSPVVALPSAPLAPVAAGRGTMAQRPASLAPSASPSAAAQAPAASSPGTTPASVAAGHVPSAAPATRAALAVNEAAPAALPQTAGVLKEIVRALRVEHAPSRALALLDQHGHELASQAFAEESLLLRVEAMLALGERAAVLRLLDRTALADLAVSSTLLITRGELRASAHRCAEGVGDFDLVLAESRRPPKAALLGRARCRQQLGDLAGARADIARYQREFPDDPVP